MTSTSQLARGLALTFLFLAAACGKPARSEPMNATPVVEGIAQDAKGGAVVVTEDRGPVYLEGIESWPLGITGQRVLARGSELVEKKYLPDPINERGELVQGAVGNQWVLRGATWQLAGAGATGQ